MWNAILIWLGLRQRPGEGPTGIPIYTKKNVRPSQYYRRGGSYYSYTDDSLIEDIALILILDTLFSEGAIRESFPEPELGNVEDVDTTEDRIEPDVDIFELDVDTTPVIDSESIPEPTPEPVKTSVSSGSSYSSGYSDSSSSYDSGGSDSGGSDD